MIPIIFEANETSFTTNGLGRLPDAVRCEVTEERNGEYELEMEYPVTGLRYKEIQEDRLIYAKPADGSDPQPFRIYKISRPIDGIVTINAEHISYMLNKIPVMPFTAQSCASAISMLETKAAFTCPFTFWTDKSVSGDFILEQPKSIRAVLGGEDPSILSVYGKGEFEFDKFIVKLYLNRGADRGVTLRYGKNITDLNNNIDITNSYTGIVPYWKGSVDRETILVTLPDKVVWADEGHADEYAYRYAKAVDFSSDFEEQPTIQELTERAQRYLADNEGWKVNQNIKVSFVQLWQSEEYKDIAPLERVKLCDTVTVVYPKLDVNVKMKVVKTEYDVLKERYISVELGDPKTNLYQAINEAIDTSSLATKSDLTEQTSLLEQELDHQTDLITGGLGGYIVIRRNADGQPEELLVLDEPDIEDAVNVIRINKNGIAFSNQGYEGPFSTAWTIDSHFSADFITTGILNANLIKTGTISSINGNISINLNDESLQIISPYFSLNSNGTIVIRDQTNPTTSYLTLSNSTLTIRRGNKNRLNIAFRSNGQATLQFMASNGTDVGGWFNDDTMQTADGWFNNNVYIKNGSSWIDVKSKLSTIENLANAALNLANANTNLIRTLHGL